MSEQNRRLRWAEMLLFARQSLNESVLDEVVAGGYTDVVAGVWDERTLGPSCDWIPSRRWTTIARSGPRVTAG